MEASAGDGPPGGSGGSGSGGGGGGGGDGGNEDEDKVLSYDQVEAFMKDKKIKLPADMLETARQFGLRQSALTAYAATHTLLLSGLLVRNLPYFRDRILADPLFLFKIGAEVAIDSGCTTVAEVRKRGKDFWAEFEFYLSDLFVGLVLDVVLVSLMAPVAVLGGGTRLSMASTPLKKFLAQVPSAFFEANVPGKSFSTLNRFACLLVKFCEYSLAGMFCGFIGQSVANQAMLAHRSMQGDKGGEHERVTPPPVLKTALVWGLFMGVSSNLRYQTVFGIERLVDMTLAKRVPQIAYVTTICVRFANNVFGGENFIDLARWAGIQ